MHFSDLFFLSLLKHRSLAQCSRVMYSSKAITKLQRPLPTDMVPKPLDSLEFGVSYFLLDLKWHTGRRCPLSARVVRMYGLRDMTAVRLASQKGSFPTTRNGKLTGITSMSPVKPVANYISSISWEYYTASTPTVTQVQPDEYVREWRDIWNHPSQSIPSLESMSSKAGDQIAPRSTIASRPHLS